MNNCKVWCPARSTMLHTARSMLSNELPSCEAEFDTFLDSLPVPRRASEAELLVISADCKGVPLVKADAARVGAFENAKKRPGNRRMATVTSAYTVNRHIRTPEQIVTALFRDNTTLAPQPSSASAD